MQASLAPCLTNARGPAKLRLFSPELDNAIDASVLPLLEHPAESPRDPKTVSQTRAQASMRAGNMPLVDGRATPRQLTRPSIPKPPRRTALPSVRVGPSSLTFNLPPLEDTLTLIEEGSVLQPADKLVSRELYHGFAASRRIGEDMAKLWVSYMPITPTQALTLCTRFDELVAAYGTPPPSRFDAGGDDSDDDDDDQPDSAAVAAAVHPEPAAEPEAPKRAAVSSDAAPVDDTPSDDDIASSDDDDDVAPRASQAVKRAAPVEEEDDMPPKRSMGAAPAKLPEVEPLAPGGGADSDDDKPVAAPPPARKPAARPRKRQPVPGRPPIPYDAEHALSELLNVLRTGSGTMRTNFAEAIKPVATAALLANAERWKRRNMKATTLMRRMAAGELEYDWTRSHSVPGTTCEICEQPIEKFTGYQIVFIDYSQKPVAFEKFVVCKHVEKYFASMQDLLTPRDMIVRWCPELPKDTAPIVVARELLARYSRMLDHCYGK